MHIKFVLIYTQLITLFDFFFQVYNTVVSLDDCNNAFNLVIVIRSNASMYGFMYDGFM